MKNPKDNPVQDEWNKIIFEKIKKYFNQGCTYKAIIFLLRKNFDIQISLRTLQRLLTHMNMRRRNVMESTKEELVAAIILEVEGSGCNLGYRPTSKSQLESF